MRKELIILLQFVLITALVGYGYFGLLLSLQGTNLLTLWNLYEQFLISWIHSFTSLSFTRFAVYYFAFRKGLNDSIQPITKTSIAKEASRTIQYLILAVVSIPISFYIIFSNHPPEISPNIVEMWGVFREAYFAWLIGFFILSLLNLFEKLNI